MKDIKEDFLKLWHEGRGLIAGMAGLFGVGIFLIFDSLFTLRPGEIVTRIGYDDLGGYRDGNWSYMLAFLILGVMLAFVHNLIAVRLFAQKGKAFAGLFLAMSMFVGVIAIIYLGKLLGEA
jgi:hypothetical protein